MATEIYAARQMLYHAASLRDQGREVEWDRFCYQVKKGSVFWPHPD